MRRELNAFIAKCANEHFDDIVEAIADGHRYAATTIDAADGGVDIISDCRGGAAVTVQHADEENQRECPLLCEAIEKALPKWEDVKEEYEAEEEEEAEEFFTLNCISDKDPKIKTYEYLFNDCVFMDGSICGVKVEE